MRWDKKTPYVNGGITAKKFSFFVGVILLISISTLYAADEPITVKGIGYPPIRAKSGAQARLMARRAAVLDAYRNALKMDLGTTGEEDTRNFYIRLSGFVKGTQIVKEEYLSDGGVSVTLKVLSRDFVKTIRNKEERLYDQGERREGDKPKSVTLEEWYKIVDGMVSYK